LAAILALEAVLVVGALHIVKAIHLGVTPVATVSFAVFLGLGYPWLKTQRENLPFGFIFFGGYLACVAAAIGIHALAALHGGDLRFSHAAALAITATFLLKVPLLALACVPLRTWLRMLRATNPLWLYATLAGMAAWFLVHPAQSLWTASGSDAVRIVQTATFDSVQAVLRRVLPDAAVDAANFAIATPRYSIDIARSCSGMEGLGLVVAFTSIWLWYTRKECRFPQALLLIPCGLVCIWALNVVRLCALFLIGNSGNDEIADVGFHSQFGWIAFTAVALVFSMATQKLSWVRKAPCSVSRMGGQPRRAGLETVTGASEQLREQAGESPAIRAYLVPFLAILAAAFVSRAASGYFEWLYPLRFVAAAIALWYFWPELKKLNWRFGWIAPVTGAAVFLMWIAPSWIASSIASSWIASFGGAHQHAASRLGTDLAALSPSARWAWIAFRVAAAVITVPIAEELAFRGYLARRLMDREFDRVSFSSLTLLSIGLSSVVFGLEHMKNLMDWQHLALGTLAGLAFAAALRWRGRMGDAVVAHAVSNILLAAWVLGLGDWAQW
jgi:exosortase E/protease (VPEID-CTERM system)